MHNLYIFEYTTLTINVIFIYIIKIVFIARSTHVNIEVYYCHQTVYAKFGLLGAAGLVNYMRQ